MHISLISATDVARFSAITVDEVNCATAAKVIEASG